MSKSLSTSERFAAAGKRGGKLGEFCQTLYQLLVPHADDFGRQQGDVFTVKMAVFPTSPRKQEDFHNALTVLQEVGLIRWYEIEGRKYIQVNNFEEHQIGLHKRTHSHFPEPPDDDGSFLENPSEQNRTEQNRTKGKARTRGVVKASADDSPPGPVPGDLLAVHQRLFIARYQRKPMYDGRDAAVAKRLIAKLGFADAVAMVEAFFASRDRWIADTGHGMGCLASSTTQNKLIAEMAKRSGTVVTHPAAVSREVEETRRKLAEMDARPVGQWKAGA